MPLGAVGGDKPHAVAGLYTEFNKGGRKASDAPEKFLRRDGLPAAITANHLRAQVRKIIDGVQEARGKRAVVHGPRVTLLYPSGWRNAALGGRSNFANLSTESR
jgi:hypothetical protein